MQVELLHRAILNHEWHWGIYPERSLRLPQGRLRARRILVLASTARFFVATLLRMTAQEMPVFVKFVHSCDSLILFDNPV